MPSSAAAAPNLFPPPQKPAPRKSVAGPTTKSEPRAASFPDALSKVRRQSARKTDEKPLREAELEAPAAEKPANEAGPTEEPAPTDTAPAAEESASETPTEENESHDHGDSTGDQNPNPNLLPGMIHCEMQAPTQPVESDDEAASVQLSDETDGDAAIAGVSGQSQPSTARGARVSRVSTPGADANIQSPEAWSEDVGEIALLPTDGMTPADEESDIAMTAGTDGDDAEVSASAHPVHNAAPAGAASTASHADANSDALAADLLDAPTNAKPLSHPTQASHAPAPPSLPMAPEAAFAQNNHDNIVRGVHGELLPKGGTMQIRLDPPQLGDLQVTVHMRDGVMTASFQTTNDDATRMLSHSLNQLKQALESQGVSVERLHVAQAPKSDQNFDRDNDPQRQQHQSLEDQASARQEQQRKEMLKRLWRRLGIGEDPLDLVA